MPRRVSLPAADDLFRPTAEPSVRAVPDPTPAAEPQQEREQQPRRGRRPSGRVRHDEKMTVYVTSEELLELEQARLRLRSEHGLAVDRGRLVRAAISLALADLDAEGLDSGLVQRLLDE